MRSRRQILSFVAASTTAGCLQLTDDTVTDDLIILKAPATTTPLIHDGTVYVGSQDHNLYAADLESGREIFTTDLDDEVGRGLTYADGIIYGSSSDRIFGIDAEKGDVVFQTQDSLLGSGVVQPLVENERIYYSGSTLTALDSRTGEILWRKDSFTWNRRPSLVDNILIVSDRWDATTSQTKKSRIYGLDPGNGNTQWTTDIETDALLSPIVSNREHEIAVVTGEENLIAAFDITTGTRLWQNSINEVNLLAPPPIVDGDTVVVPAGRHGISAYDLFSGDLKWSRFQDSGVSVGRKAKLVDENIVFITESRDGTDDIVSYQEIDLDTGDSLINKELDPKITEYTLPVPTMNSIVYPTQESTIRRISKIQ